MKSRVLVIMCTMFLLLSSLNKAYGQSFVQYTIQINSDNSATWIIIQAVDINASVDSWSDFQYKVATLIDAARNETKREMTLDEDSLQMATTISWETQSKTIEYTFKWQNFSVTENSKVVFGDVFQVANFFSQLYGDGELQIAYPPMYTVESVSPTPNRQNSTFQTLEWISTQYFMNGKPTVTLATSSSNQNANGEQQNTIIALGSATIIAGALVGFYMFRRRNRKGVNEKNVALGGPVMESGEEEIIKVIRSSGGSLHQSMIAEQCRFSKAKTSQLLASLEQKGVVRRYKKGRDKIVTLANQSKK
jgi:uncharacterized membrane protein